MEKIDPQIKNLVSAIGQAETGISSPQAYQQKGASGEFGRYQFMPETYKAYAKRYLGDENAEPTIENQNKIAYSFVKEKKDTGYNPAQIASMWNAGEGKPDAYKENYRGINDKGVSYDTPAYVERVSNYYNQSKIGTQNTQPTDTNGYVTNVPSAPISDQTKNETPIDQTLGQELSQRGSDISKGVSSLIGGKDATGQTRISGLLQTVGGVAGGIGDIIGKGLELIPGVKQVENLIGQGVGALAQTETGQAVMKSIQEFSQEHPELAKDIGAGFNIVTAIPILRGLGTVAKLGAEAGSQALKEVAERSFIKGAPEVIGNTQKANILLKKNPNVFKDMVDRRLVGDIKGGKYVTGGAVDSSWKTITDSNNQIKSILKSKNAEKYTFGNEDTQRILTDTLNNFPNSKFTGNTVISNGKKLTPQNSKLWDKFITGDATLEDINKLRSDLDIATKSVYTSVSEPPIRKELGKSLADSMRNFVKAQAPETEPLFNEMSTQFDIQKALNLMNGKQIKPGMFAQTAGHVLGTSAGAGVGGLIGGGTGAVIGGLAGDRLAGTVARKVASQNITQGILKRTGVNATKVSKDELKKKLGGLFGGVVTNKTTKSQSR